jgi:heme exporter protein B
MFIKEIIALIRKEFLLEWKQKYALNGLLLYVVSMVVVVSLAFFDKLVPEEGEAITISLLTFSTHVWNILFWIILLFIAINAIAKSFMGESSGQLLYQYTLARPSAIILSRILYNTLLLVFVGLVTLFLYMFLSQTKILNLPLFLLAVFLGGFAFAANLTLISAIAAKAENKMTLLAVLSFPVIVPVLLSLIRLGQQAISGFGLADNLNRVILIGGLSIVLALVSVLLFPFVWRD